MLARTRLSKAESALDLVEAHLRASNDNISKIRVAYCTARTRMANLQADYKTGLKYATEKLNLLEAIQTETGEISQKLCSAYTEKATAMIATGNLSLGEMLPMLQISTNLLKSLPGFTRTQLFNAPRCEGTAYRQNGQLKKAEEYFLQVLRDRQEELGSDEETNVRYVTFELKPILCPQVCLLTRDEAPASFKETLVSYTTGKAGGRMDYVISESR